MMGSEIDVVGTETKTFKSIYGNYSAIEQKDFTRYLKKSEVFALMLLIL